MNRRSFFKRLFGGAAVAVASLYVPSRPWDVAVPKPPIPGFRAFVDAIRNRGGGIGFKTALCSPDGGFLLPLHISDEIAKMAGLEGSGVVPAPWRGVIGHWGAPGPGEPMPATQSPSRQPSLSA